MDVDNVLSHIGDFGPAQKKIYFLISLTHLYLGFHTLILSFIGTDPGWRCEGAAMKCSELGHCTPEYLTEYTSIVTEV